MKELTFTLFWLTGQSEIVTGINIADAVNKHYGGGAISALDFWSHGDTRHNWEWNKEKHTWLKIINTETN